MLQETTTKAVLKVSIFKLHYHFPIHIFNLSPLKKAHTFPKTNVKISIICIFLVNRDKGPALV